MNNFFSVFNPKRDSRALPWQRTPSIYTHIQAHLDPITVRLKPEGVKLPDDERANAGKEIRWAPGALDGVQGHHFGQGGDETQAVAHEAASRLLAIAQDGAQADMVALYELMLKHNVLSFIDPTFEELGQSGPPVEPHLHAFARLLAQEAPDREPVKLGIALLGIIGDHGDQHVIELLGTHEEFTLFSAVALGNMLPRPEAEAALMALGQKVEGWGHVQIVERLAETESAEVKGWLLRNGCRGDILDGEIAYICADTGDLCGALAAAEIDDALLDGAGAILWALVAGGPAQDIDDYAGAAEAVARYLAYLQARARTLGHFLGAAMLKHYLEDERWATWEPGRNGWTDETRTAAARQATEILEQPQWPALTRQGLTSTDDREFSQASHAAEVLNIDTWDAHWRWLQEKPVDGGGWYDVMQRANAGNIDLIVGFALEKLPLAGIATGPARKLGLGPEYAAHNCLDMIVPALARFPGKGWPLIAAALGSPVTRNRNLALRTLAAWTSVHWPPEAAQALSAAYAAEPEDDVRERLRRLLAGEPLEGDRDHA